MRTIACMRRLLPWIALTVLACASRQPTAPTTLRPADVEVEVRGLANVQRTLRLLETSTETRRNRVRVLFYGQSITESAWSRQLEAALRARYPYADLEIENRSIGGHASQLLIKAAESDLYPYYPDLMILHVVGAHDKYDDLIRRVRERTTTEVLHQTDHVFDPAELDEPSDPATLGPNSGNWSAFMNHAFLPSLVERYQTALCDQRAAWKHYLRENRLEPAALLSDEVHINAAGDDLMAALVGRCLRAAPELGPSPAEQWVTTHEAFFEGDTLKLSFEGNRVDVIMHQGAPAGARVEVRIDGKLPSEHPELYGFARAHAKECGKWPPVFALGSEAPLLLEVWTLSVERVSADIFAFSLVGSKTGEDGSGRSDQRFVSRSGRVVIEPEDWNLTYALKLAGSEPPPARVAITFRVEPHFVDTLAGVPGDPAHERSVTVAQGLSNGPHVLELRATGGMAVRALRTYRPPLTPTAE